MERRTDAENIQIEERSTGMPLIRGTASAYNKKSRDLNGFREIIAPGAFDEVLERQDNDVICCWNHDPGQLIGRTSSGTLRLSSDSEGLRYEVDPPDTTLAKDLMTMVRRGDIFGSSFAFTCGDEEWEEDEEGPVRVVRSVSGLFDVALVTSPAYMDSAVAVRSLESWLETKQEQNNKETVFVPSLRYKKLVGLSRIAQLGRLRKRKAPK